ncbi:hypothetical protein DIX60_05335 [Streptococcus iniae]|uniref:Uncharacterized protein n=1 Tax=Streptococcus iniae TaxID=1346 RepID=A0A1S1XT97_STRIN|nr:hypothetical protein [Streptococcus iniae]ESR10043.1 hypothetical protein IUSA1_03650 [Streptococcus iniae IUSA1]KYJ76482.1 hypothetical protein NA30_07070 [Streptococcus iniae]OHX26727.1 hypothetical protein BKX95_08985 [Streptococcus iniae]RLU53789.1 hypothetical protein DIY09_05600 [Streptococcus iniae]RLU56801.1 hypothetical protein DIY07_05685 [Streptococcus iniae]
MKTIDTIYNQHAEMPHIEAKYERDLLQKPIPKRNMIRTKEGLLPGHIVMLWRIQFGTYTTEHPHHKYFYTTYGIDAQKELEFLIAQAYVTIDSAFDSLKHLSSLFLKEFLKSKEFKGLSKMKRQDLEEAIALVFDEQELGKLFTIRGYSLLEKGRKALEAHPEIIEKHPQKKY